ncbi:MAG: hypothetical protein ACOX5Z_02510 [Desulfobulbus sp.]|jgi:hypothetical protein
MSTIPCADTTTITPDFSGGAPADRVEVEITAKAAGKCQLSEVADLRKSQDGVQKIVIDLNQHRPIANLELPEKMQAVYPWIGAKFQTRKNLLSRDTQKERFSEVATDRLQVTLYSDNFDLEKLRNEGAITLPDTPTTLTLTVNGRTAWTHFARNGLTTAEDPEAGFCERVDITRMVHEEIDAGNTKIPLVLHATPACRLGLKELNAPYRLVHAVRLPGQALSLTMSEEGPCTLSLPLPEGSGNWQVAEIHGSLSGKTGESRVVPAEHLPESELGELVLDPDHYLAARLDKDLLAGFQQIEGVRLPLVVTEGGAEIVAMLRRDEQNAPGTSLPEARFAARTVPATDREQWVSLDLEQVVDVPENKALWLELRAVRGRCWWRLGSEKTKDATGEVTKPIGVVELQRAAPGGVFAEFIPKLNNTPHQLLGRLRIKGRPTAGGIAALQYPDSSTTGASETSTVDLTPGRGPLEFALALSPPLTSQNGALNVQLLCRAPGLYTFSDIRLIYTK